MLIASLKKGVNHEGDGDTCCNWRPRIYLQYPKKETLISEEE